MIKKAAESKYGKYFLVFGINFLIAFISFLGILYNGEGIFTLCNDFNEQQIPFHMLANHFIKNGNIFWNWNIDIGSSFAGALGFYVLGSPFAWLSFLFPDRLYPYVTGWLYMMKYAVAGTLAFLYIRRFVKKERYALLGEMLYAFSGFQCVNLIFHHFHDAVAFFPLLLIGYEKLAREGKKGAFALGVFVNAFVNYYFFIQEVIFLILYFFCREGVHLWKKRKLIGNCLLEGILGMGMAGVLLIPSVLFTLQNPRLTRYIQPDHWFYKGNRDYLQAVRSLFFPGELMCAQSCIKEYDWTSWSAYLPMVSLILVICYIIKKKKDWLSVIMTICLAATGIPVLNSAFGMFSDTNYHRWLFMLILLMSLASAVVLEERKGYFIKSVSGIVALFTIFLTLFAFWWSENRYPLINEQDVFLLWSVIGIAGAVITFAIAAFARKEKWFSGMILAGVAVFSVLTTGATAQLYQGQSGQSSEEYYNRMMAFQDLQLPKEEYRLDSNDNTIIMTAPVSGTGSFTSMVNGSIYEFYEALGTERAVFSPDKPEGIKELLGGKYYIKGEKQEGKKAIQILKGTDSIYYLYEKEALPIVSTRSKYMTKSEFDRLPSELRAAAMIKCLIVPDDMEKEAAKSLEKYNAETDGELSVEKISDYIKEQLQVIPEKFEKDTTGFQTELQMEKRGWAFFTVPYDKGFKAYVNGNDTKILKSNGLMALPLEAGKNEIEFVYTNWDLLIGVVISIVSWGCWAGYRYVNRKKVKS